MNCRKCKAELPENAVFCHLCGTPQNQTHQPKRRGNGTGTAVRCGKYWRAVWTDRIYIDENGKLIQHRKTKSGFRTKNDALRYASDPPTPKKKAPTLREYWNTYKAGAYLDLSKSKQTAKKIAWEKLKPVADREIGDLTIGEIQAVVDEKAPTYYTARDIKSLLSALYKLAVAEGNARANLSTFIHLPKLEEKEAVPFSEDEIKALWNAYAGGNRFVGYLLVMIYTGMMPGELLLLKKDMIDYERREIIGNALKTDVRKKTPLVFPEILAPVLSDLAETTTDKQNRIVDVSRDNFYAQYHEELGKLGVRDLPPYSCRHTTATALALGNIAPSVIQKAMRHAKFQTTQRYIHPDMESVKSAMDSLKK